MTHAPYRFAPVAQNVVAPDQSYDQIDVGTPRQGTYSGVLSLSWIAQTPVCVGGAAGDQKDENGLPLVLPVQVGGRYCLPGSSLKGMLRSVSEIACHAHLGMVSAAKPDRDEQYAWRTIPSQRGNNIATYEIKLTEARCGWLSWSQERGWALAPVKNNDRLGNELVATRRNHTKRKVHIDRILTYLRHKDIEGVPGNVDAWRELTIDLKYSLLQKAGAASRASGGDLDARVASALQAEAVRNMVNRGMDVSAMLAPSLAPASREEILAAIKRVRAGQDQPADGPDFSDLDKLVFTGYFDEPGKKHEYNFSEPGQSHAVSNAYMNEIHRVMGDANVRASLSGEGNITQWEFWMALLGHPVVNDDKKFPLARKVRDNGLKHPYPGYGIPVFYYKPGHVQLTDLADAKSARECGIYIDFSPIIRKPYRHTLSQVLARTHQGETGEGADAATYSIPRFDEPGGWDFAKALFGAVEDTESGAKETGADDRRALRSRVEMGFAMGPKVDNVQPAQTWGTFNAPRASYSAFYLDASARGGGQRGYDSPHARIAGRKRYPVKPAENNGPLTTVDDQTPRPRRDTALAFLPEGTCFQQTIRFKNLTQIELGALVWALTFGSLAGLENGTGRYCHSIGRARAYGYGAIKPRLEGQGTWLALMGERGAETAAVDTVLQSALNGFEDYMKSKLNNTDLANTPAVKVLRAAAHMGTGAAMSGQLKQASLTEFSNWSNNAPLPDYEETDDHS
ncbi:hypothetical protein [Yunchengibacter salinarum]|uniref:hypothetical protein n=1 Tax=Yunchengibacter salinarum TaxID=3133399 RepID=UPI0035B6A38E